MLQESKGGAKMGEMRRGWLAMTGRLEKKPPRDAALGSYRTTRHDNYLYGRKTFVFLIIPPEAGVGPIEGGSPGSPLA